MQKKLYYVVNARMPSNKAYGIQIAKMCEAFVEAGVDLELVIPRTRQSHISMREFYQLRVDVPTRVLACPDWYDKGNVAYAISSLLFTASACLHIYRYRRSAGIYTIDMDQFYFTLLALLGIPVAIEMHSIKPSNIFTRYFFRNAHTIITTNSLIKENIAAVFAISEERFIVEPNGVDETACDALSKCEARKKLGLPESGKIVLYVGRFYDWKGMDIVQKAAEDLQRQGIQMYMVGGTREDFEHATRDASAPLHFGGSVAHKDIALWCAAADVLLVLGTRANEFSYRYTAPMKLFEYLAAARPTICADTPALRSLVSESEVAFYTPDDSADLAWKIVGVLSDPEKSGQRVMNGLHKARRHTWHMRATRIRAFIA